MKNQLHRMAAVIGFSALLGSALLGAPYGNSTAEIPFDFQVRDRALPAGTYTVSTAPGNGMLNMTNRETGESIFVSAPSNQYRKPGEGKIVFRKYGARYFLGEVCFASESVGHKTLLSNDEKELIGITVKSAPVLASIRLK